MPGRELPRPRDLELADRLATHAGQAGDGARWVREREEGLFDAAPDLVGRAREGTRERARIVEQCALVALERRDTHRREQLRSHFEPLAALLAELAPERPRRADVDGARPDVRVASPPQRERLGERQPELARDRVVLVAILEILGRQRRGIEAQRRFAVLAGKVLDLARDEPLAHGEVAQYVEVGDRQRLDLRRLEPTALRILDAHPIGADDGERLAEERALGDLAACALRIDRDAHDTLARQDHAPRLGGRGLHACSLPERARTTRSSSAAALAGSARSGPRSK